VPSLRRWAVRALDVAAVFVVAAAIVRFGVLPRLHGATMTAPPLTLARLDGGSFALAAPRRRIVFLEFWATWCDPCRASIPLVQGFRRSHPGVEVVSVDVGEPPQLVRPFAERFAMRDVALDPEETAAHAFGVVGFPTLVAIDPHARVHVVGTGYDPQIERAMDEAVVRYATVR
jgi:thiol-disulfide isomerase/thioredoxin